MPLLKRKRILAAKVESTPGTAETLTAAEAAFNVYDLMIQPTIEVEEREQQGGFDRIAGVPGARQGKATFKTDIAWDGTATLPTWATVLLPACGYVENTAVFTPRSEAPGSNVKTLTIGGYVDGLKKVIAGASGTFKMMCVTGKMITIEWEFTGAWQPVTDVALLSPTYPTASPIRFASGTIELDNVAMKVESCTFDAGNEVKLLEDPSTASGFSYAVIVDRKPRVTINPEAALVATRDPWGDWLSSTTQTFELDLDGANTSVITMDIDVAQIVNVQEGDRGKIVTDEIEIAALRNTAADDDVSFTFTATV